MTNNNEFSLLKYDEVQLKTNPLVVVVCQVSFESVLAINDQSELSKFQKMISDKYPVFKSELADVHTFDILKKTLTSNPQTISKFLDKEENWRVTLSKEAISLEAFSYISRSDFKDRFQAILLAFEKVFQPKLINRIGVRYVNRLTEAALKKVETLVNPSLLTVYKSELIKYLNSNISEAFFTFENRNLLARWGLLPAHSTIDPNMVKPIPDTSWILDIDSSNSNRIEWSSKHIIDEIKALKELNYGFFRWSTTQNFLDHYVVVKK